MQTMDALCDINMTETMATDVGYSVLTTFRSGLMLIVIREVPGQSKQGWAAGCAL